MRPSIINLLLICLLLLTAGCGYHLRGTTPTATKGGNKDVHSLNFSSSDPYGPTARAVREQLLLNNITIVNNERRTDIPSLRLLGEQTSQITASIFRDGKTAEYQMVMTINAQVLFPGSDIYPLQAKIYRSFFDNPLTALAKDAEEDLLKKEMRTQAAQRLIRQMLMLDPIHNPKSSQPVAIDQDKAVDQHKIDDQNKTSTPVNTNKPVKAG